MENTRVYTYLSTRIHVRPVAAAAGLSSKENACLSRRVAEKGATNTLQPWKERVKSMGGRRRDVTPEETLGIQGLPGTRLLLCLALSSFNQTCRWQDRLLRNLWHDHPTQRFVKPGSGLVTDSTPLAEILHTHLTCHDT